MTATITDIKYILRIFFILFVWFSSLENSHLISKRLYLNLQSAYKTYESNTHTHIINVSGSWNDFLQAVTTKCLCCFLFLILDGKILVHERFLLLCASALKTYFCGTKIHSCPESVQFITKSLFYLGLFGA